MPRKNPEWISKIKAIGWDLDGTLYPDSRQLQEEIRSKQYEAVSEKYNWDLVKTREEYQKKLDRLGSNTKTMDEFGFDGREFFSRLWESMDLESILKRDEKIVKMFAGLKSRRHFLISNANPMNQIIRKLNLIGLDPRVFELVVDTVSEGAVKPDPKPFLIALERMKLEPEEALFVGDKVTTDIRGAKSVGMKTCLVWKEDPEADVNLPTVYEVLKLLNLT